MSLLISVFFSGKDDFDSLRLLFLFIMLLSCVMFIAVLIVLITAAGNTYNIVKSLTLMLWYRLFILKLSQNHWLFNQYIFFIYQSSILAFNTSTADSHHLCVYYSVQDQRGADLLYHITCLPIRVLIILYFDQTVVLHFKSCYLSGALVKLKLLFRCLSKSYVLIILTSSPS